MASSTFTLPPGRGDDLVGYVGLNKSGGQAPHLDVAALRHSITLKLAANGFEVENSSDDEILNIASDLFRVYREQSRLLESHLCPVDQRIQDFLNDALQETGEIVHLPNKTLVVDRYGLARELSFPDNANEFSNSEITSYRLSKGGVLHNPLSVSLN
jgi:phosphoenolpyruvate carboxykinase (diphosphate)